jgi:glutathione S-transferase
MGVPLRDALRAVYFLVTLVTEVWRRRAVLDALAQSARAAPQGNASAATLPGNNHEDEMAEYQLYCFAQSGNAYRAALMLNLIGADWEPIWVDFFAKGEPRTPEYRTNINEMGEAPVLVHGGKKLSQSGVILTYLAERSGKFRPEGEDERLEALRWIIFDNQKVNGFLGPYRFLRYLATPRGDPAVLAFLKGRIDNNLAIVDKRLSTRPFVLGAHPTIADLSLVAYLYYPAEEFGFDIPAQHKHIAIWLDRIKALPGWKHPYDLMPGHPLPGA